MDLYQTTSLMLIFLAISALLSGCYNKPNTDQKSSSKKYAFKYKLHVPEIAEKGYFSSTTDKIVSKFSAWSASYFNRNSYLIPHHTYPARTKAVHQYVRQSYFLIEDERTMLLREIIMNINKVLEQESFPFKYNVFLVRAKSGQSELNAFCRVGTTNIYLTDNLFDLTKEDKNQLAFILSHEIQHLAGPLGQKEIYPFLPLDNSKKGTPVVELFLRSRICNKILEIEADLGALWLMQEARYDPAKALVFMKALPEDESDQKTFSFSSHPKKADRIRASKSYLKEARRRMILKYKDNFIESIIYFFNRKQIE